MLIQPQSRRMRLTFSMRYPFSSSLLGSGNLPLQFLDAVLKFLDSPGKFARITTITAVGTSITIRFESVDVLLALVTALRTVNLDSLFLEHDTF